VLVWHSGMGRLVDQRGYAAEPSLKWANSWGLLRMARLVRLVDYCGSYDVVTVLVDYNVS
jgi:hypothetical protein